MSTPETERKRGRTSTTAPTFYGAGALVGGGVPRPHWSRILPPYPPSSPPLAVDMPIGRTRVHGWLQDTEAHRQWRCSCVRTFRDWHRRRCSRAGTVHASPVGAGWGRLGVGWGSVGVGWGRLRGRIVTQLWVSCRGFPPGTGGESGEQGTERRDMDSAPSAQGGHRLGTVSGPQVGLVGCRLGSVDRPSGGVGVGQARQRTPN